MHLARFVAHRSGAVLDGDFGAAAGDQRSVILQTVTVACSCSAFASGFSTVLAGLLVDELEDLGRRFTSASCRGQPVSVSATGLRKVMRPSRSVATTASPMLERVASSKAAAMRQADVTHVTSEPDGDEGDQPRQHAPEAMAPAKSGRRKK